VHILSARFVTTLSLHCYLRFMVVMLWPIKGRKEVWRAEKKTNVNNMIICAYDHFLWWDVSTES